MEYSLAGVHQSESTLFHEISEVNPQKDFNIIDEALKK
jgi:hypothetical protein